MFTYFDILGFDEGSTQVGLCLVVWQVKGYSSTGGQVEVEGGDCHLPD